MNRQTRAGLSVVLAAVLSVLLCIASFAEEETGLLPEQEPAADAAATPAVTETVSPPVIIQEIQDEDYGTVEPEVIAANTPAMAGTFDDLFTPGPDETETLPGEVSAAVTPVAENAEEGTEPEAEPDQAEPGQTEPEAAEEVSVNGETGGEEEPMTEESSGQEAPVTSADEEEKTTAGEEAAPGDTGEEEPTSDDGVEEITAEEEPAGDDRAEEIAAEEEPAGEETEPTQAEKVRVTVSVEITMVDDNVMQLNAVINDPEGRNYEYQWQVSEDGGKTYSDIPEAKEDKLEIELTDENLGYMWRVWVRAL